MNGCKDAWSEQLDLGRPFEDASQKMERTVMEANNEENFAQAVALRLGYRRMDGGWGHPDDATQMTFVRALDIPEVKSGMTKPPLPPHVEKRS